MKKERIDTFDVHIPSERIDKALRDWEKKSEHQTGQIEIINAASQGKQSAVDYLFVRFKKMIAKVFWDRVVKDKWKRVKGKQDEEFSLLAYSMLSGEERPNPYNSFDTFLFDKDADLIHQFGYYFYRYLQRAATAFLLRGYGRGSTFPDFYVKSYDEFEHLKQIPDEYDFTNKISDDYTVESFLNLLKNTNIKYYEVMTLMLKGYNQVETAEILGTSQQNVFYRLKVIKDIYNKFMEEMNEN